MNKWQPSLKLLVLSNVMVGLAVIVQTIATLAPLSSAIDIWFHLTLIVAGITALTGIILASIQGFVANKEQKQDVEERLKLYDDLKRAKRLDKQKSIFMLSMGIIIGTIIYYWLHPEKRPKHD